MEGDVQRNLLRCGHLSSSTDGLRQRKNKIHISRFIASYRVRILRANEHNKRGTCSGRARVYLHTQRTVRKVLRSEPPQLRRPGTLFQSAAIVVESHSTECQSETDLKLSAELQCTHAPGQPVERPKTGPFRAAEEKPKRTRVRAIIM